MKKSILCLIVAMLLALPLLFTSCGDDMTAEEIANANFQEADTALTLSFWLPADNSVLSVDSAVDDNDEIYGGNGFKDTFDKRLVAVEEAFNSYLLSNNYCTKIKFVVCSEDEYYSKLTEKFAQIKEVEKTEGKAYLIANKYVNHAVKNPDTDIYEMAYPEILDNQLDIFFVGSYENYVKYINDGDTYSIDGFFSDGQTYNGLFKMIRQSFFDATKVDGKYYGIPNNHLYAENGQYILVNKELYDEYEDTKWEDTFTLYSLQSYIEKVGASNLSGVVPFCGSVSSVPGVLYLNEENLVAASVSDAVANPETGKLTFTPEFLPEMEAYKNYMKFYKSLEDTSCVSDELNSDEIAAVQLFDGNLVDIDNLNDYYIIETIPPYASNDTVHSSMFAISTHSANYERSMKILYLLQESVELRTILQYGVEEVDFEYGTVNGEKVVNVLDSGYKMNILYTGNCYRTYPESGVPMSYWDSVKDINLQTELHPLTSFMLAWENGNFKSQEDYEALKGYLNDLKDISQQMKQTYDGMTYSAYKDSSGKGLAIINRNINKAAEAVANAQVAYEEARAAYDAATTDEEKQTASAEMENQLSIKTAQEAEQKKWTDIKTVTELRNDNLSTINEMLALFIKLYNSVN